MTQARGSELPKLVRDHVPDEIRASGREPLTETFSSETFKSALLAKLVEEGEEVAAATAREEVISELADLLEVVRGLASSYSITLDDVLKRADEIRLDRGGFDDRVKLVGFVAEENS